MSSHPLSVQLWTVRDALAADVTGTLQRVADLGFTTVEPFGFVERQAELAAGFFQSGLTPSSAHAQLIDQNVEAIFAAAKTLGIPAVIDPMRGTELWATFEDVSAAASALNVIAEKAAVHDLTVGYHNHWWELENSIDGTPSLEVFASLLDPAVVLEVDTYWATVGGVPAAALLKRLGEQVQFIHVKDGDISRDNDKQVAVGSGRMPVLEILAAAPQAVRIVELDDFSGDVFDALRDSVTFLTAHGEHL